MARHALLILFIVAAWVPAVQPQGSGPSPYWGDAEGRGDVGPAPPWPVDPTAFRVPEIGCSLEQQGACDSRDFRSLSGRCNNLQQPQMGTPGHRLLRVVPAQYDMAARVSMRAVAQDRRRRLPNPAWVSRQAEMTPPASHTPLNVFYMILGQFVDHDMAVTTSIPGRQCGPCNSWADQACAPLNLASSDPLNLGRNRCLPFTRSVAELVHEGGQLKSLEQPNLTTSFLDLSVLYDINECRNRVLRSFSGGLLRSHETLNLLPVGQFCKTCFVSGDPRLIENVGLVAMHTLFHREHNRLAAALQALNPAWNDERLYQEARRINIAQYQHIILNHYLVLLLGPSLARQFNLPTLQTGSTEYQSSLNAGTLNEFTAAAFRMGHSQVPDSFLLLKRESRQFRVINRLRMRDALLNSSLLFQVGGYSDLMWGMLQQELNLVDLSITPELTSHLFQQPNIPGSGSNLYALNIARGRDHGLARYTSYVQHFFGQQVNSFSDLANLVSQQNLNTLRTIYRDVQDIDLYVGGLAERVMPEGSVGPTFAHIIAENFRRIKFGDRFWFESPGSGLTQQQVASIRATSLAAVLCHTMEEQDAMVPRDPLSPFDRNNPSSSRNPVVSCNDLPPVDLRPWREGVQVGGCLVKVNGQDSVIPSGATVPSHSCRICTCQQDQVVCRRNTHWCERYGFTPSQCDFLCTLLENFHSF